MAMTIEKARLYDKYRPPYASQAVTDPLGYIGPVEVVADIGAGTGQLARLFAERCARVYAVEPDSAMRQVASSALANYATIQIVAGSAEQTTLDDRSIDLIVVGNAFHRFKQEACLELRRILKPAGWVALFTYTFTNRALGDLLLAKLTALKGVASLMDQTWHQTPTQQLFGQGEVHTRSYRQSRTDDWTTFFGSACGRLEAPTPEEPNFAQFEADNREVFEEFAVNGKIKIDYETQVAFGRPVIEEVDDVQCLP